MPHVSKLISETLLRLLGRFLATMGTGEIEGLSRHVMRTSAVKLTNALDICASAIHIDRR